MAEAAAAPCLRFCRRCGEYKELAKFLCRKDRPMGRGYRCMRCHHEARRHRPGYLKHRAEQERKYRATQAGRESKRRYLDNPKNKKKIMVRRAVSYAKRIGRLVQDVCERCGSSVVEAHHDDYNKPLEVRWLCRIHHKAWHEEFGEGANSYDET